MPPFLVILLVVNVSAFSSILTKIAATDLSAAHYFLWRYLIAFLVMAFRFLFSKASLDYKSCKSGLMLGLVSVPLLFCWYQGLSLISASLSSFITSLSVIVVFIDRHRKLNLLPQWHHVIAVLTAFLGLSLLINEVHANFLGLCYSFFSALLGGVYFIWVGEIKKEGNITLINMVQMLTLFLGSGAFIFANQASIQLPSTPQVWFAILFSALIYSSLATMLQLSYQVKAGTLESSMLFMLRPLLVLFYAGLILGEQVTPMVYPSACLIVASLAWIQYDLPKVN